MERISLKNTSLKGEIYIGGDAVEMRLPELVKGRSNFVLTDTNVARLHADFFKRYFGDTPKLVLTAGEKYKNFTSLQSILESMVEAGLKRTSRLFAVGGGVVGDIGGLAAALYMRGISCVQIPTTLLAQVDSSVGGKTAIDCHDVKNVIGAFYQPCEVLIDPAFLRTLPRREWKCGIGEIVKYAALSGEIYDKLIDNADKLGDEEFLVSLTTACVKHKANVVERDEKEMGERKSLNVGHTTGHALELYYGFSHGESVLYGMLLETEIAIRMGVCGAAYGECLKVLVKRALSLEPKSTPSFSAEAVRVMVKNACSDKKNTDTDKIVMSVAKAKGEWTTLILPIEVYEKELVGAVKNCGL